MSSSLQSHRPASTGRKRKDRDGGADVSRPGPTPASPGQQTGNRVLAGYLAHEYLTKGTLLGRKWDPAREESTSRRKSSGSRNPAAPGEKQSKPQSYADVARLLMTDGAHLPGVVNPTDLNRWLQG